MNKSDREIRNKIPQEFQDMYDQMQLPQHRIATDAFFQATAEDLNRTFRDTCKDLSPEGHRASDK